MAILDLLRRRRTDDDEEDDDEAEDTGEESEDEDAGGGLLARLSRAPGLGRLLNRSGDDDDEDEGDDDDDDADDEAGGSFFSRLNVLRRLRRGGGEEEDAEDDELEPEQVFPPAGAAPEPPVVGLEASPSDGGEGTIAAAGQLPIPGGVADPAEIESPSPGLAAGLLEGDEPAGEDAPGPPPDEVALELPPIARRLRDLARSQEDVPAEELAEDLRDLLSRFERGR